METRAKTCLKDNNVEAKLGQTPKNKRVKAKTIRLLELLLKISIKTEARRMRIHLMTKTQTRMRTLFLTMISKYNASRVNLRITKVWQENMLRAWDSIAKTQWDQCKLLYTSTSTSVPACGETLLREVWEPSIRRARVLGRRQMMLGSASKSWGSNMCS